MFPDRTLTSHRKTQCEYPPLLESPQLDEATEDPKLPPAVETADPLVTSALRRLSPAEREVLLLVAWDDLTPAQGAETLGISAVAFRVRLLRARRHFQRLMDQREGAGDHSRIVEMESA